MVTTDYEQFLQEAKRRGAEYMGNVGYFDGKSYDGWRVNGRGFILAWNSHGRIGIYEFVGKDGDSIEHDIAWLQTAAIVRSDVSTNVEPANVTDAAIAARIWLKTTHEADGWQFGYFCDKAQDDAFVEYVRADSIAAALADQRERHCAALCGGCREGAPLTGNIHRWGEMAGQMQCQATAIRSEGEGK